MAANHSYSTLNYLLPLVEKIKRIVPPPPDINQNPDQVYTPGSAEARSLLSEHVLCNLVLPGSSIKGFEHLKELHRRCQQGESCLLMMEHYGNFDLPGLCHLLSQAGEDGQLIADSLLAIQAIKLTAIGGSPLTAAFASCYSTITIYPSRNIDCVEDQEEKQKIRKISSPINHAAMREMTKRKYQGRILLMFPTGTRYRPWSPDSKRGVREVRSYLKVFQNIVFVGINGNILAPSPDENMVHDLLKRDVLIYTVSSIVNGRTFLHQCEQEQPRDSDNREFVAAKVMQNLEQLHRQDEGLYQQLVEQADRLPAPEWEVS